MKVALLLPVLCLATAARAEPAPEEDQAFVAALVKGDAKAIAAAIALPFHGKDLAYRDAGCAKSLGKNPVVTDEKQRGRLAACLAKLKVANPKSKDTPLKLGDEIRGDECTSEILLDGFLVHATFARSPERPWKVTGLVLEVIDGVLGGELGTPKPLCADWQPAAPQDISPATMESLRTGGSKRILPDEKTAKALAAAGRDKAFTSWKLCLDDKGAIAEVGLVKSSGVPAYDAAMEAGIRAWTFKPLVVDGKGVAVCTAITFIYSQK